jgi:hypothetical protein
MASKLVTTCDWCLDEIVAEAGGIEVIRPEKIHPDITDLNLQFFIRSRRSSLRGRFYDSEVHICANCAIGVLSNTLK